MDFEQLQDLALLAFELAAQRELRDGRLILGGNYANEDAIVIPGQSRFMTRKVVEGLVDRRLIKKLDFSTYEISAKGLSHLQKQRKNESSFLRKSGASALLRDVSPEEGWEQYEYGYELKPDAEKDGGSVPASDRTVTLNHNQPDYQEAVDALDKVVEAFCDDHRLDNELGHERGALLKALEGGRELLNDTVVNVRIGTALLVEPLQRLALKYENQIVGALASNALNLVIRLLGL